MYKFSAINQKAHTRNYQSELTPKSMNIYLLVKLSKKTTEIDVSVPVVHVNIDKVKRVPFKVIKKTSQLTKD